MSESVGTCRCPTRYDRPVHYAGLFRKDPKSPLVDEIIQQYALGLETGQIPYGYIISQAYILQTTRRPLLFLMAIYHLSSISPATNSMSIIAKTKVA